MFIGLQEISYNPVKTLATYVLICYTLSVIDRSPVGALHRLQKPEVLYARKTRPCMKEVIPNPHFVQTREREKTVNARGAFERSPGILS